MANASVKALNSFYRLDSYYNFLSAETKAKYPLERLVDARNGVEGKGISYDEVKEIYNEIVSAEALAVQRKGVDKVSNLATREAVYVACEAEIPGYKKDQMFINGPYGTDFFPAVDQKRLDHVLASQKEIQSLENNVARGYDRKGFAAKVLKADVVTLQALRDYRIAVNNDMKISDIQRNLRPYIEAKELDKKFEKISLSDAIKEAEKYYKKVDPNYKYESARGGYRYGVKCEEGMINLQQKAELTNKAVSERYEELHAAAVKENGGNELSKEKLYDVINESRKVPEETLEKIYSMSYAEAKQAMDLLPVSISQTFVLTKTLGVPKENLEGLNRKEAGEQIKAICNSMQEREVSPDIRKFAEEHNLVKAGEKYTYAQWTDDSKRVEPMPAIRNIAERLNLDRDLEWRKNNVNGVNGGKPVPGRQLTHDDYVSVITHYYANADLRMNGPVLDYQLKAVPEAKYCKNWQEAEKLYLDTCKVNKLIGEDEHRFLMISKRDIPNCPTNKLLDPSLSDAERKEMADKVRNTVQNEMIKMRIRNISNPHMCGRPETEMELTDANRCVRYAISQVVGSAQKIEDYLNNSRNVADIARVAFKSGYHAGPKDAGKDIVKISSAIMSNSPGLVGMPGTNLQRYKEISKAVETVKKSFEKAKEKSKENTNSKSASKAKVERRHVSAERE